MDISNYATKAIEDLILLKDLYIEMNWLGSAVTVQDTLPILETAQKFIIPNGNSLMDFDISKSKLSELNLRLPYPSILLEYEIDMQNVDNGLNKLCSKRIALAVNRFDIDGSFNGVYIVPLWYDSSPEMKEGLGRGSWVMSHTAGLIEYEEGEVIKATDLMIKYVPILPELVQSMYETGGVELWNVSSQQDVSDEVNAIVRFLIGFNCSNVEEFVLEPPIKLNKKRLKKGKVPFFEHRVLKIKPSKVKKVKLIKDESETSRKSPRRHKRGGHPRYYKSGLEMWITDMMVGSEKNGTITKDYLWEL